MSKKSDFKTETMISDIKNLSLTGMMVDKKKDKLIISLTLYTVVMVILLIFVFPTIFKLANVDNLIMKILIVAVLYVGGAYICYTEFVLQQRKKDKQRNTLLAKNGDLISYFMKIKDMERRLVQDYIEVLCIENLSSRTIPLELTYNEYSYYANFINELNSNGLNCQEYELRGKISLFKKYRNLFPKYEGTTLIKFLESIFRENEKRYINSPSRRLYVLVHIPYSKDFESTLVKILTSSRCKIQFLNNIQFKDMIESYFGCPVNLEKLTSSNVIKTITLEGSKLMEVFNTEEEMWEFLKNYNMNFKNKNKYRRGLK